MDIHTDIKAQTFSPTALEDYLRCPRLFYFRKVLHLEPKVKHAALTFGEAIHSAVGTYYLQRQKGLTHEEVIELASKAFLSSMESLEIFDPKRNCKTGLIIVNRYLTHYQRETMNFVPDMIEVPGKVMMPNGTSLVFRIDRIWKENNFLLPIDTKTHSGGLTDYFFAGIASSLQMLLYYVGIDILLGNCDGVQIDGIEVPYKNDSSFQRRTYPITEAQKLNAINTYCEATDSIIHNALNRGNQNDSTKCANAFPCNPGSCMDYGGCTYSTLCKHYSVDEKFLEQEEVKEFFNVTPTTNS